MKYLLSVLLLCSIADAQFYVIPNSGCAGTTEPTVTGNPVPGGWISIQTYGSLHPYVTWDCIYSYNQSHGWHWRGRLLNTYNVGARMRLGFEHPGTPVIPLNFGGRICGASAIYSVAELSPSFNWWWTQPGSSIPGPNGCQENDGGIIMLHSHIRTIPIPSDPLLVGGSIVAQAYEINSIGLTPGVRITIQ
jgi:hypothetical protein